MVVDKNGGRPTVERERKSWGVPNVSADTVIELPSGAHAGLPCNLSESQTIRAFVPSSRMT